MGAVQVAKAGCGPCQGMEFNGQHSIPSLGRRDAREVGSSWPPSPGKSDRGVKNEPGRVGARKAREIKSNLDPDLKGMRLSGARHLDILSTACHTGLALSTTVRESGALLDSAPACGPHNQVAQRQKMLGRWKALGPGDKYTCYA